MKLLLSCLVVLGASVANAYDANYVHKFTCSGGVFFGVPVGASQDGELYIPVDVNGTFCTVYPGTRLSAGGINCMNLRIENIGKPVSQCTKGN